MKKFKKSSVIVPALARIAVTAAASVSGTVAWFTATRTANATGGQFVVGTNEGDLKVSVSNGVGVTNSVDAATAVTIVTQQTNNELNTLLDASYNGEKIFTDYEGGATAYKEVNAQYATDSKYYYAFSWDLNFTVDVSKVTSNYDIFFDVAGSSVTENTAGATASALRVSMGTGTSRIVWAPNSAAADAKSYVVSTTGTAEYAIASVPTDDKDGHGLIANDNNSFTTKATSNGTNNSKRGDYLGTCTKEGETNTTKLSVHFVVWYEGLDKNLVNGNLGSLANLTTNFQFYARESA